MALLEDEVLGDHGSGRSNSLGAVIPGTHILFLWEGLVVGGQHGS